MSSLHGTKYNWELGPECTGCRGKGRAGVETGRLGREDFSSLGI